MRKPVRSQFVLTITLPLRVSRCHCCASVIGISDAAGRRLHIADSICRRCRTDGAEWDLSAPLKCRGCGDVIGFATQDAIARPQANLCLPCNRPFPAA